MQNSRDRDPVQKPTPTWKPLHLSGVTHRRDEDTLPASGRGSSLPSGS